jgi:pimeloyl-ACP methyl ester carboxylesterase
MNMAYEKFVPLPNLNFQFNRVLGSGPEACREEELWEIAPHLRQFNGVAWYEQWSKLAVRAESQGRHMHAAYYYRMSEFFLPDRHPEKNTSYANFQRCFYRAMKGGAFERVQVPYTGGYLPALRMNAPQEKGVVLIHGGFDSFMEEFYLSIRQLVQEGFSVIAFEGPGQGGPLRQGLKMDHQWEKPVAAVLDHFNLDGVCLIGISLGGYLALRAAACEQRISKVVAFDVVWDALAAFAEKFEGDLYALVLAGKAREVDALIGKLRRANDMVDWMVSHGMHITGANSPFEYLHAFSKFSAREISSLVKQDVLLLAGEKDHFVPAEFYHMQKSALTGARSVTGRFFRAGEPGDRHCQVGDLDLAWGEIIAWLNSF